MQAIRNYLYELRSAFGTGWTRFWFTPADPSAVCALRVLVGLAATYFLLSHSADLLVWFGKDGLLPAETVRQLIRPASDASVGFRWSYLFHLESSRLLWVAHALGCIVALAFTLGLFTRISAVLTLAVVLSYVHRAPMIAGPLEPILTMLLFYLCFAPCGYQWSLDQILKRVRTGTTVAKETPPDGGGGSLSANISIRLIQIHLAALYLMMGLTKLAGETWWRGDAIWWLIAHTESRLVDLTFLHRHLMLMNFWTHAVVAFELSFAVLVWNRLARPLLLWIAVVMWLSLALVTGLVSFCAIMMIANLCYVSPETWREAVTRCGLRRLRREVAVAETP